MFLTNGGGGQFTAATFAESATGRWVAMDVGDFDADGDPDLLLGAYINGPTPVPQKLFDVWQQLQQPLLLLENQRSAAPKVGFTPKPWRPIARSTALHWRKTGTRNCPSGGHSQGHEVDVHLLEGDGRTLPRLPEFPSGSLDSG